MDSTPQSPEWWVARLYKELVGRRDEFDFYDRYYRGDHDLPWLAPQAREEFRRILQMTRSNYMGLVVDAQVERQQIEGFRVGDSEGADADLWSWWQANHMDSDSDQVLLEAAICGRGIIQVAPMDSEGVPQIWVEHPSQVVIAYEPGTNRRRRAAALKVWTDDWTDQIHAVLQTPMNLFKYQAPKPIVGNVASPVWAKRAVRGEKWGGENTLGVVSFVEIPNNPRLLTGGVSELADVTDVQDRVNKTIADRLITQDYGAFPQKWIKAWPDEDEDGNPTPAIEIGRNRVVTTSVAETAFGQWDSAPLDPYSNAKREDVRDIASRTRTPAQYLLGDMSNVNGETLKASESGLISKVRQRNRGAGEAIEVVCWLARKAADITDSAPVETIWRDPQYRTEGEVTDAVMKRLSVGIISLRQAREDTGYSQAQIKRLEEDDSRTLADPATDRLVSVLENRASGTAPSS